jgi:hypothetical protein
MYGYINIYEAFSCIPPHAVGGFFFLVLFLAALIVSRSD